MLVEAANPAHSPRLEAQREALSSLEHVVVIDSR